VDHSMGFAAGDPYTAMDDDDDNDGLSGWLR
jgi:hypothetical protein